MAGRYEAQSLDFGSRVLILEPPTPRCRPKTTTLTSGGIKKQLGPQLGPNIALRPSNFEPRWLQYLQFEAKLDQDNATSTKNGAKTPQLGAKMAQGVIPWHVGTNLAQLGPNLAPTWPNMAATWPNLAQRGPDLAPTWPNLTPTWGKPWPFWPHLA